MKCQCHMNHIISGKTSPSHNLSLLLQFSRVKLTEEIQTLLEDNALSQGDRAILAQVSSSLKLTLDKETRADDPDWFIGLSSMIHLVAHLVANCNLCKDRS